MFNVPGPHPSLIIPVSTSLAGTAGLRAIATVGLQHLRDERRQIGQIGPRARRLSGTANVAEFVFERQNQPAGIQPRPQCAQRFDPLAQGKITGIRSLEQRLPNGRVLRTSEIGTEKTQQLRRVGKLFGKTTHPQIFETFLHGAVVAQFPLQNKASRHDSLFLQKLYRIPIQTCSCGKAHLALVATIMRHIRTAARALIIHEKKILSIKMRDRSGIFYILPGGGQRHGETLHEGLKRECLEEIGTQIEIGPLLYVREYIGKNHEFHRAHRAFHQVENVFLCTLPDPTAIGPGSEHDKKQIGVEWIPISELPNHRFLPEAIKPFFKDGAFTPPTRYLGDVN